MDGLRDRMVNLLIWLVEPPMRRQDVVQYRGADDAPVAPVRMRCIACVVLVCDMRYVGLIDRVEDEGGYRIQDQGGCHG